MPIIQTIDTATEFQSAFERMGRGDQFSRAALEALFEHYNECGETVDLDPVAICCDWGEYNTALEAVQEYGLADDDYDEEDDAEDQALSALNDHTMVLSTRTGTVVVASF